MAHKYAEIGVSRLTSQFQNSPRFKGFITAFMQSLEEIEKVADDLRGKRWIETSHGAQLDGCGHIVGEPRNDRLDEPYRAAILNRIGRHGVSGTPVEIINVVKSILRSRDLQYLNMFPAGFLLFSDAVNVKDIKPLISLEQMYPAGVGHCRLLVSYTRTPFRLAGVENEWELYVLPDDNLVIDGCDTQITGPRSREAVGSSTLGSIVMQCIALDGDFELVDNNGTYLVINPVGERTIAGSHILTGVFDASQGI